MAEPASAATAMALAAAVAVTWDLSIIQTGVRIVVVSLFDSSEGLAAMDELKASILKINSCLRNHYKRCKAKKLEI